MEATKKPFEELRRALLAERAALVQQIRQGKTLTGFRDGDDADVSTFDRDSALRWTIEEHEIDRILGIDAALRRMDARTYGICELCGEEMPLARLVAVPIAKLCVDCQAKGERQRASEGAWREAREMMLVEDLCGDPSDAD